MEADTPSAAEIFNAALEIFDHGDVEEAVSLLRAGFFENLYVAPVLLGERWERQPVWHPGDAAEPGAASEYTRRYGRLWAEKPGATDFLREVWNDPLVRGEIRSFINVSKAILQNPNPAHRDDLLRERRRFADLRRIRGTRRDIVARLASHVRRRPAARPRIGLILLASRDAEASVEFYRKLLGIEPVETSRLAGGFAEFELPGVRLGVHGHDRLAAGDPYRLGLPPESLGWGAIIVVSVPDLDRCRERALAGGIDVLDEELEAPERRFFLVKDPSGYLIELTEEREPRGF